MEYVNVEFPHSEIRKIPKKQMEDIIKLEKEEDCFDEIVYKGFRLIVNGFSMGAPIPCHTHHYNGYICPIGEFPNDIFYLEEVEDKTHCGWTGGYQNGPGFDCAHAGDTVHDLNIGVWNFPQPPRDTFKSKEYVFWKLKNVADKVIETDQYKEFVSNRNNL